MCPANLPKPIYRSEYLGRRPARRFCFPSRYGWRIIRGSGGGEPKVFTPHLACAAFYLICPRLWDCLA